MRVEVVTSGFEGCPNCSKSVAVVKKALNEFPNVDFREINSINEPERIQELGFVSSGAIVINGKVEFSSTPNEKKLRKKLEKASISDKPTEQIKLTNGETLQNEFRL